MSRAVSLGYLVPAADLVRAEPWLVTPQGRMTLSSPDRVDHWDYSTDLVIERQISVDASKIKETCGLDPTAAVRGLISWRSTKTLLQGASDTIDLVDGPNQLTLALPGALAGGTLRVRTIIACGSHLSAHPLAPKRVGSVLWSDDFGVQLEGDQSRLPTEIISFAHLGSAHADSAWYLDLDMSDLNAPVLGRLKLYINSDHPVYMRLGESAESLERILTAGFLEYDIARQLVVTALANEEFTSAEYERGSVGRILRRHLVTYFGEDGEAVEPLRARWWSCPNEIDSELQRFFLK